MSCLESLFFSLFHFSELLLMGTLFNHCGLVGSVGIIGAVNCQQGIIAHMKTGKSEEKNNKLPHETVPLENKGEVPPHFLDGWIGIHG